MKASELGPKSDKELNELLIELRKEQFGMRMQKSTGQLANTAQLSAVKKDIARIKTVMNQNAKAGVAQ